MKAVILKEHGGVENLLLRELPVPVAGPGEVLIQEKAVTIHHVHNPDIEMCSAAGARAIWAMEDQVLFPEGVPGPFLSMHGFGFYYEILEKQGTSWKIKSFTLERIKLDFRY
jgi:hypothetical protein